MTRILMCCLVLVSTTILRAADPPAPSGEITLQLASWADTEKLVASHKGKIVVVDVWSSSCVPCVKELPHLAKLQKAHPADVVGVSLNCNYIGLGKPEEEKESVLKFLTKREIRAINLLCTDADDQLYKKLEVASIPVVRVYGRDGKLVKQFDNDKAEYGEGFSYEMHINPFVAKLVQAK